MYVLLTVITIIAGISGMAQEGRPGSSQAIHSEQRPKRFEEVLNAHGRLAVPGSGIKARVISIELTMKRSPADYFERRVITVVDGRRMRRETVDPHCLRTRVETVDDQGNYYGSIVSLEHGNRISTQLSTEGDRVRTIAWLVETNGLLPLLLEFARPSTRAYWVRRTIDGFDEFHVETQGGQCTVYTDEAHFIRSIKTGEVVLMFSHYQPMGGLKLPYVERVLLHGELVREIYFSSIELNPTFEAGYFNGPTVPEEQCR
jgi:hypothetical protein